MKSYWRLDQVESSKGYSLELDGADDALRKNPFEMPPQSRDGGAAIGSVGGNNQPYKGTIDEVKNFFPSTN